MHAIIKKNIFTKFRYFMSKNMIKWRYTDVFSTR